MSRFQVDEELLRKPDEDELQRVDVSPEWEDMFTIINQLFIGTGGGWLAGVQRTALKGLAWQARKRVAAEPAEAREFVRQALQAIAACLRIEPVELFPDLETPAAPVKDEPARAS